MSAISRRSLLKLAGLGTAAGTAALGTRGVSGQGAQSYDAMQHAAHTMGPVGRVSDRPLQSGGLPSELEFLEPGARRARTLLSRDAAARRHPAAGIRARRRRSRDRDRARHLLSGLDVQRPGAGPDPAGDGRGPRPGHLHQPGFASAHDSLPRMASARDGRLAAGAPGDARRQLRLRVRRRSVRHAPVPLPRRSAEAPHPQGPLRGVHRRSEGRPARRPTSS